ADVAAAAPEAVARSLGVTLDGLTQDEAARRLAETGYNAVRTHHARRLAVLARQLHSPLLLLLAFAASVSFFVGQRADAVIIAAIVTLSVGLGFANEYRAERAAEALHSQLRPTATVQRGGTWCSVDVTAIVPGDVVRLELGTIVPADARVLRANALECDESVLTGESVPADKSPAAVAAGTTALGELTAI